MERSEKFDRYPERGDRSDRGDNFDVTLRRFFRDVQQSGLLTEIKKRKFRSKDISREKRRVSARHKAVIRRMKRGY